MIPGGLELVAWPDHNWQVRPQDTRHRPPSPLPQDRAVQWYVPYTVVRQEVAQAAPLAAVWVDVSPSPNSYFGALHEMWSRGKSFAVLEHDVICRPDVIDEFESCPEPWCIYGYSNMCHRACMEAWRNALGCTRFRSELMRAVPDAVSSIPEDNWDWHNVCDGLGNNLRAAGFQHHWHEPWVDHHPWTEVHP
jgi:hypothetical protein